MTDKHALSTPPGAALQGLDDLAALAAPLSRLGELTRDASLRLGLDAQAAAQAAADGGLVLGDAPVSVTAIPLSALAEGSKDVTVISVAMARRIDEMSAADLAALLAHAPGLLAVSDATLGCQPDGSLVLHRVLRGDGLDGEALAAALLHARQLVQLISDEAGPAEVQ